MAQFLLMIRPHRKASQKNLHSSTSWDRLSPHKILQQSSKEMGISVFGHLFGIFFLNVEKKQYISTVCGDLKADNKDPIGDIWTLFHASIYFLDIYLGRCWRWIRRPDSQTDSSPIGASTPDSTFSWTAGQKEKRRGKRKKYVVIFHLL